MENKFLSLDGLSTFLDKIKNIFATKEQGAKADSALQKEDISSGIKNGTIKVRDLDVNVKGLGSAAYANSSDFASTTIATTTANGLMSSADKNKINGISNKAIKVVPSVEQPLDLSPGDLWLIISE